MNSFHANAAAWAVLGWWAAIIFIFTMALISKSRKGSHK